MKELKRAYAYEEYVELTGGFEEGVILNKLIELDYEQVHNTGVQISLKELKKYTMLNIPPINMYSCYDNLRARKYIMIPGASIVSKKTHPYFYEALEININYGKIKKDLAILGYPIPKENITNFLNKKD